MSKEQKKTAKKTAFRMTVAERMREYGVPEGGTTLLIEHGAEALPGNADQGVPAQVYLRWVGKRDGEPFTSAMRGPWGVTVCGTVIEVEELDRVELVRDRNGLEERSRVEGLTLQMAEVQSGSTLGDWRPVIPAAAGKADEGSAASGQAVDTPLKRAAVAAMDLFDMIDALSDEDSVKAIEVLKQRAKVSMLGRSMRKAVPA